MEEIEFRKRLYAAPDDPGREVLDAASENPALQSILERTRGWNRRITELLTGVELPPGLSERLRAIPEGEIARVIPLSPRVEKSDGIWRHYAMAASLTLAIGFLLGYSLGLDGNRARTEVALGEYAINHLYFEEAQIGPIADRGMGMAAPSLQSVNQVMLNAGTTLIGGDYLQQMRVRFANPCLVVPGFQSAHLIMETGKGRLNILVINNSPVEREHRIGDDRFSGIIIPSDSGNLVLISESPEAVDDYRRVVEDNVDWVI